MTISDVGLLAGGLLLLVLGAELLVRGASRIAAAFGVSPLVIGLTVVAYGTSTPELAVSLGAAFDGHADIAMANVVGSNIFNVLFILGTCALVLPLVVDQQLVRRDVPVMIGVSVLALVLALDGEIGPVDGALLTVGILLYTARAVLQSRRETAAVREEYAREYGAGELAPSSGSRWLHGALVLVGFAFLAAGARGFVAGAIAAARSLGVDDTVIGLTVVAAGTSLPEVATSILATIRGERDIAVGNVIGSNIYNVLAILGLTGLVAPGGLAVSPAILRVDLVVMIAVAVACLPIFVTGYRIDRWEGALFLLCWLAYTTWLVLDARGHASAPVFGRAFVLVVLPLALATLAVVTTRRSRGSRSGVP